MQYSMSDIRELGFRKLFTNYNATDFFKELHILNSKMSDLNIAPYSVLGKLKKDNRELHYNYIGFKSLVKHISPLNDCGVEEHCKRSFRRFWTTLWGNVEKDVSLNSDDVNMLFDLGIKLAFTDKEVDSEIYEFFNYIIFWGLIVENEYNCEKLEMTWWEVIAVMTRTDNEDFKNQVVDWGMGV